MKSYNFKRLILQDKTLLTFFLFFFVNSFSYSTELFFNSTLIPFRIALMVILLLLCIKDEMNLNRLDKVNNRLILSFIFFYSFSFIANITVSDPVFFFSVIISILVCSLFINYINRHYQIYASHILLDIFFYSLFYIPLILILNPSYISLNLYGSNTIEELGVKSRYLGWASCILYGILLYQFKLSAPVLWKKIFLFFLIFFVIVSGSRSAVLGICASSLLFFWNQKNKIRYVFIIGMGFLVISLLFKNQISDYINELSFQKRFEARESGLSDDSYRARVFLDAMNMSLENIGNFIFGFGPGIFKETLKQYYLSYSENELSSHNTFLEVFITSGVFSFVAFIFLYVIKPLQYFYLKRKEMLYVLLPVIIISATENNFGLGQYLFVMFSLLAFYSFKI